MAKVMIGSFAKDNASPRFALSEYYRLVQFVTARAPVFHVSGWFRLMTAPGESHLNCRIPWTQILGNYTLN